MSTASINGISIPVANNQASQKTTSRSGASRSSTGQLVGGVVDAYREYSIKTAPIGDGMLSDIINFAQGNYHTFNLSKGLSASTGLSLKYPGTVLSNMSISPSASSSFGMTGWMNIAGTFAVDIQSDQYTILYTTASSRSYLGQDGGFFGGGISSASITDGVLSFSVSAQIFEIVVCSFNISSFGLSGYLDLESRYGNSPLCIFSGDIINGEFREAHVTVENYSQIQCGHDMMNEAVITVSEVVGDVFYS